MDKKSILNEIKNLLKFNTTEEIKEFVSEVVGDQTIKADSWEVGSVLMIETPEGDIVAPAGEYLLANGSTLIVGEEGVITEVSVGESVEEEAFEEEVVEPVAEEVIEEETQDNTEVIDSMNNRISELENLIKELITSNSETAAFSKSMGEILERVVKSTPAQLEFESLKAETTKNSNNEYKKGSVLDSISNARSK